MNGQNSIQLSVILPLVTVLSVFFWHYRWQKKGNVSSLPRSLMIAIIVLAVLSVPVVDYFVAKGKWRNFSFEGVIVGSRVTEQHALKQFSIKNDDGLVEIVLDEFWKFREFEVGDRVRKAVGEDEVIRVKN